MYDFIAADSVLGRDVAQVFKDNNISGNLISELTDNDVRQLLPNLKYGAILRLRQLRSQHTQPVTIKVRVDQLYYLLEDSLIRFEKQNSYLHLIVCFTLQGGVPDVKTPNQR